MPSIANSIDPPPRLTGDPAHDLVAVMQWMNSFYTKGILAGGLLQTQNFSIELTAQFDALFEANYSALAALAALVSAANTLAYYTGENTLALTDLTAFARTLLAAANASTTNALLGLGSMALQDNGAVAITGGTMEGSFSSSDSSAGITQDVTTASLVGKTLSFKDGICTGFI